MNFNSFKYFKLFNFVNLIQKVHNMKKLTFLFAMVFTIVSCGYSQPKLEVVGGNYYDWGTTYPKDSPLKAKIKIKNAGNDILKIYEVKPGCGCTTAPLDKTELKQGEEATLDVSLNTSSYTGNITKSIRISSNDPTHKDVFIYLKTNVFRPIVVLPNTTVTNRDMEPNKEASFEFQLKNQSDKPITITNISYSPDDVKLNLSKGQTIAPNQVLTCIARITPKQVGNMNGYVRVATDDPNSDNVYINLYGVVKDINSGQKTPTK